MHITVVSTIGLLLILTISARAAEPPAQAPPAYPARQLREYRDFALGHDGSATRGRELFNNEQRAACAKCHSVDGSTSKAGPDLFAIGDKFPRLELIRALLEPSVDIAVGYGTTIIETKSGDEFTGIVKEVTADVLDLVGADGRHVRISTRDIKEQRGSSVSQAVDGSPGGVTAHAIGSSAHERSSSISASAAARGSSAF